MEQSKDRDKSGIPANSPMLCDVVAELVRVAAIDMTTCVEHVRLRHRVLWPEKSDRVKYLFICLWETLDFHTQERKTPAVDELLKMLRDPDGFYTRDAQRTWLLQSGLM